MNKESGKFVIANWDELRRLGTDGRHLLIVAHMIRPGAMTFIQQLEWQAYEPGTIRNKDFNIFVCKFLDEMYTVTVVPLKHKKMVMRIAGRMKMRLADGVPAVVEIGSAGRVMVATRTRSGEQALSKLASILPATMGLNESKAKIVFFPLDEPTVFTLENAEGSPVHGLSPFSTPAVLREEGVQAKEFHQRMLAARRRGSEFKAGSFDK